MLTRTGRALAVGGGAFIVGGLAFGNWPFVAAGAMLVVLVSFSALARAPRVERRVDRARIERGGRFAFEVDVDLPRGLGVAEVHQALPDEFALVEGNNFRVLTFGLFRKRRETLRFTARAPKRGEYVIPPVSVKVVHPLGFSTTPILQEGPPVELRVEPRARAARLPRDLRTRARRPFPDGDVARLGVATNEFRELREYLPGDPPRRINWKATARRMGTGESEVPLVNETEWEGKKSVWILVDGHPRLSVGTNIEDAREHAADAALSLMQLYLRRGYQVGMALVRSGPIPPLRPGTGEAQVVRAREMLARLAPADSPAIMDVLERDAAILHRGKPLVVLVTRASAQDDDLRRAILRLGAIGRMHGRAIVPALVLDVSPPLADDAPATEVVARRALDADRVGTLAGARTAGLRVAEWRAGREPLESVLVRGRIA